jgi:hypothetical protein
VSAANCLTVWCFLEVERDGSAGPHNANQTWTYYGNTAGMLWATLPYSHNLTPSDSCFFGPSKKHLDEKQFEADADVKQAVTSWLQIKTKTT